MLTIDAKHACHLLVLAQRALGMTQEEFGALIGVSRRTIIRWQPNAQPIDSQMHTIARAVYPRDPDLAAQFAAGTGTTLEALGIVEAAPSLHTSHLVDSIVCAAAEAAGTPPQAIRPALLAALDRAAAVGLTADQVRSVLNEARAKRPGKRRTR